MMRKLVAILVTGLLLFNSVPVPLLADAGGISDKELLDLIEERAFRFFWDEANPANGLVKDKALNFGE